MSISESLVDRRTIRVPFPTTTQINVGDLLWWDSTNKVGNTASNCADQGSAALNQAQFSPIFLGVAADMRLSTETAVTGAVPTGPGDRAVVAEGIFDCSCASATFEFGDLVGIARNSSTPANYAQQVAGVASTNLAIGQVVKREPVAVTKVRVFLSSYKYGWFSGQGDSGSGAALLQGAPSSGATAGSSASVLGGAAGTGAGGPVLFTAAAGGNGTTGTAGAGGAVTTTSGAGGTATTGTGGAGGTISLVGGAGGAASGAAGIGGAGAAISIAAGTGGATASTTGGNTGVGGAITVAAGASGASAATGAQGSAAGGAITITSGASGTVAGTSAAGASGALSIATGAGGAASSTGAGGAGGLLSITGGVGGAGSATGTGGAGAGVTITAGAGGATSGAGQSGIGGAVTIIGGAAGTNAAGTGAAGGAVTITGGLGTTAAAGGAITITSGAAGATGVAGAISIAVGAATAGAGSALTLNAGNGAGGTAAGGNINLVPGTAVSTGVPGTIQINSASGLFDALYAQGPATVPTTSTSYTFFMANRAYRVVACSTIASTAGGSGCTVTVTKDTSTNAPGAGTAILTGAMALSGSANTRVSGTLTSTVATLTMAAGDRLATTWAGTISPLAGATVSVTLAPC